MRFRRWIGPALGLTAAALLLVFFLREPGLSAGAANGSYTHDCCGTFQLDDGLMLIGEKHDVRYSLGRDEAGPFLLPATYVGPWEERGIESDGGRPPLKLRLDRLPRPNRIVITDGRRTWVFTRKQFRLRAPPERRP
jgi:hypothetical protein